MNDKDMKTRVPEREDDADDALLSLLRSAYPAPPPGLTGRVMERIRSESREEPDEKILATADSRDEERRSARRRTFVRWGALAACIVLVGTMGLKLLPAFTRNLPMADHSAADMSADEAVPEMAEEDVPEMAEEVPEMAEARVAADSSEKAAVEEEMPAGAAVVTEEAFAAPEAVAEEAYAAPTAGSGYGGSADDAYDDAPVAEEDMYDGAWIESSLAADGSGIPENGVEDGLFSIKLFTLNGSGALNGISTAEEEVPMMGAAARNSAQDARTTGELQYYYVRTSCAHAGAFRNSYHAVPDVLIARVGPQLYGAWATKAQNEDLCGVNILSFAVRFGLTAEDMYATGDVWYFLDLPEDIPLTEENAGAVEEYYLNGGDPGKMVPRLTVYELKTAMVREAGMTAYLAWRGDGERSMRSWSVREGAAALGLDEETMERLYEEAAAKVAAEYGDAYMPQRDEVFAG